MSDNAVITMWEIFSATVCFVSICVTICSLRKKNYEDRWQKELTDRYKTAMTNGYEQRFELVENEQGRKCQAAEYSWVKVKSA